MTTSTIRKRDKANFSLLDIPEDTTDPEEQALLKKRDTLDSHDTQTSKDDQPQPTAESYKLLISLLLVVFCCMTLYMNVSSLLPEHVKENYPELNSFDVGCLMAIFPIGYLTSAPLIGSYMESMGRKNMVSFGVVLMTLSTLTFGLAGYFPSTSVFYFVSLFARFCQGIAEALINITVPSIVAQEFPRHQHLYLGYCYNALGLGLAFGPVLGSVIYTHLTYVNTFYCFTFFIFVFGALCMSQVPDRINSKTSTKSETEKQGTLDYAYDTIGYKDILTNWRSIVSILLCVYAMTCCLFIEPILAVRLVELDWPKESAGLAFGTLAIFQAIGGPVSGLMSMLIDIRLVQQIGIATMSIALLFIGPSELLHLPPWVGIMFIGLIGMGFAVALMYVLVTPEIIEANEESFKNKKREHFEQYLSQEQEINNRIDERWNCVKGQLTDKASALSNMSFAFGSMLGPLLGGYLTNEFGYVRTCDIMCVMTLVFAVLYFLVVTMPQFICKKCCY